MEYITENSLHDFPAWSGGKDTLNSLTYEQKEQLETMLPEFFPDTPTDTQINDFLWFERDTIADVLGFRNWQHLEYGDEEEDEWEEDEDDEEDDDYIE